MERELNAVSLKSEAWFFFFELSAIAKTKRSIQAELQGQSILPLVLRKRSRHFKENGSGEDNLKQQENQPKG